MDNPGSGGARGPPDAKAREVWEAALRRLSRQWGVAARLVEGHTLVTEGPYRAVRQ